MRGLHIHSLTHKHARTFTRILKGTHLHKSHLVHTSTIIYSLTFTLLRCHTLRLFTEGISIFIVLCVWVFRLNVCKCIIHVPGTCRN